MFQLGEMFVKFTGKDGGLSRSMKLAESYGKNVTTVLQSAMWAGSTVGVAGAKAFDRIAQSSIKASVTVSRSFAKMVSDASKSGAKMAGTMGKSLDRITATARKLGGTGIKGLTSMGTTGIKALGGLGTQALKTAGDFTQMTGSISGGSSAAGASMGIFKTIAGGVFSAITIGIVSVMALVTGLGLLIGKTTLMASSMQETKAKFDIVFGAAAPEATKQLDLMARAMGRSTDDLIGMAAGIQDLLVPIGIGRDKAAKMSVSIAQLAVDMASFNNVSDEEVIENISAALAGSGEVMKKYGIIVNEVTLKQELAKMGYHGTVEGATEQMKALARLNIIIKGSSDAHGDAVRTGDGFANQMKRITSIVSDVARIIGKVFLPAAEVFAKFFSKNLQGLKDNATGLEGYTKTLEQWATTAVQYLQIVIDTVVNWKEVSTEAWDVVGAGGNTFLLGFVTIMQNLGTLIMQFSIPKIFGGIFSNLMEQHKGLWGFMHAGWTEIMDFISSGGSDAIELGFADAAKKTIKELGEVKLEPFDTSEFVASWEKLSKKIEARTDKTKKNLAAPLPEIKPFDAKEMGIDIKHGKVELEISGAADQFKKSLEAVFKDKEKDKQLEILKDNVRVGEKAVAAAVDNGKKFDNLAHILERPLVG